MEPDERQLTSFQCRVEALGSESWNPPESTTVIVTNRRTVILCPKFDTGGGWVGFGAIGLAVSTTANAVSKHRANQRSAGLIAAGHIRHEWVLAVILRKSKALLGPADTNVDIIAKTTNGWARIELWGKSAREDFARWLVTVVAAERLQLAGGLTDTDRQQLKAAKRPGSGHSTGAGRTSDRLGPPDRYRTRAGDPAAGRRRRAGRAAQQPSLSRVIVGGGDGRANLGVWLRDNPADFGVSGRESPPISGRPGRTPSLDQPSSLGRFAPASVKPGRLEPTTTRTTCPGTVS